MDVEKGNDGTKHTSSSYSHSPTGSLSASAEAEVTMALEQVSAHVTHDVSRLRVLHFSVGSTTSESPVHPAANLISQNKKTYWLGTSHRLGRPEEVVLKLKVPALVGFVKVFNRSSSEIELAVSSSSQPSQFITVQRPTAVARHRRCVYRTGFLPARYVRIRCLSGKPISLFYVQIMGLPTGSVVSEFGAEFGRMLVDNARSLFYDPIKPLRCDIAHWDNAAPRSSGATALGTVTGRSGKRRQPLRVTAPKTAPTAGSDDTS